MRQEFYNLELSDDINKKIGEYVLPAQKETLSEKQRKYYEDALKKANTRYSIFQIRSETDITLESICINPEKPACVIIHGRGNGECFQTSIDEMITDVKRLNAVVFGFNFPGVQGSIGKFKNIGNLLNALNTIYLYAKNRYPNLSIILKCHSLSAACAAVWAHSNLSAIEKDLPMLWLGRTLTSLSDFLENHSGLQAYLKTQENQQQIALALNSSTWELSPSKVIAELGEKVKVVVIDTVRDGIIPKQAQLGRFIYSKNQKAYKDRYKFRQPARVISLEGLLEAFIEAIETNYDYLKSDYNSATEAANTFFSKLKIDTQREDIGKLIHEYKIKGDIPEKFKDSADIYYEEMYLHQIFIDTIQVQQDVLLNPEVSLGLIEEKKEAEKFFSDLGIKTEGEEIKDLIQKYKKSEHIPDHYKNTLEKFKKICALPSHNVPLNEIYNHQGQSAQEFFESEVTAFIDAFSNQSFRTLATLFQKMESAKKSEEESKTTSKTAMDISP